MTRSQTFAPAIVVAVFLALNVTQGLAGFNGNPTGFTRFGRDYAGLIRPPSGASVMPGTGYDGQYFWALARDPLLLQPSTLAAFRDQGFRLQRVAYPSLAFALSAGRQSLLPWTLLGINVGVILALTAGFSAYATRRGWSAWWALALGFFPGLTIALIGDMSDALAVALLLGGLLLWRSERRLSAAAVLGIAALAREPMVLAPVAIVLEAAVSAWRGPRSPGTLRRQWQVVRPAILVPGALFLAWQVYVHIHTGISTAAPATAYQPPLMGIVAEVEHARDGLGLSGVWDLGFLAVMLAAIAVSVGLAVRRPTVAGVTAALFGLSLLVVTFGSDWSYTRLSAPMFACLLLAGLEQRSRSVLALCAVAAGLGLLV